jgi:hypothetical protein
VESNKDMATDVKDCTYAAHAAALKQHTTDMMVVHSPAQQRSGERVPTIAASCTPGVPSHYMDAWRPDGLRLSSLREQLYLHAWQAAAPALPLASSKQPRPHAL